MTHVLVTGASTGLGRQLSIDLSKRGYCVFITGRDNKELEKTESEMIPGFFLGSLSVDLSDTNDLAALSSAIVPDILINCAGIFPNGSIEETDIATYEKCFAVNVRAPFILMKNYLPSMKKNKWGRIINIGSSSAYAGFPDTSVYCASKHALLGLTRSAFNECKNHNVRVISVSPGSIKTPMGKYVKNQDYDTFIEPEEASKFIIDLLDYDGNMVCDEVRINRMFVQ